MCVGDGKIRALICTLEGLYQYKNTQNILTVHSEWNMKLEARSLNNDGILIHLC